MHNGSYSLPVHDLAALSDILLLVLDPRMVPFWLLAIAVGLLAPGRSPRHHAIRLLSLLAIANVALYWILIPYRTQQRFFLQALGVAVVPLARVFDASRWLLGLGLALLGLHVFTAQGWPLPGSVPGPGIAPPFWDLSPIIPSTVGPLVPAGAPGPVGTAVLLAGCLAVAVAWVRCATRPRPGVLAWLLAAAPPVMLVAGWYALTTTPDRPGRPRPDSFYPPFRDFYRGWMALERASGARGSRVAYAGTNIPYYLMARGLRNDVRYVNVDRHRDWLLHDYHRQAIREGRPHWPDYPRPGWDRERPDFDAWLANLRDARIELLVVTYVNPAEGPHNVADRERFPIERRWADEHPDQFRPLHGPAQGDPLFRLYRVEL
jgi:hypothetical protein